MLISARRSPLALALRLAAAVEGSCATLPLKTPTKYRPVYYETEEVAAAAFRAADGVQVQAFLTSVQRASDREERIGSALITLPKSQLRSTDRFGGGGGASAFAGGGM